MSKTRAKRPAVMIPRKFRSTVRTYLKGARMLLCSSAGTDNRPSPQMTKPQFAARSRRTGGLRLSASPSGSWKAATYRQSASSLGTRASPDRGQDGNELGTNNGLPIPPVRHGFKLYPATPGPSSKPSKPRVWAFLLREFQRVAPVCEVRAVPRAWTIYPATTYTSRGTVEIRISERKELNSDDVG